MLSVEGVSIGLRHNGGNLVRDLTFHITASEVLGLVGESGSGKSLTALAITGLLPSGVELQGGSIEFASDVMDPKGRPRIAMIFQDPRGALNPTMRVGEQIARLRRVHQHQGYRASVDGARRSLGEMRIPGPDTVMRAYPHQLSGGMAQRVSIALALACNPRILIADEPTTALDVTVQAEILHLLRDLIAGTDRSMLFISHDLAAVAGVSDHIAVMYGGQLMELGPSMKVLHNPMNPYTRYLVHPTAESREHQSLAGKLEGCRFLDACPEARAECNKIPPLVTVGEDHKSACVNHVLVDPETMTST